MKLNLHPVKSVDFGPWRVQKYMVEQIKKKNLNYINELKTKSLTF